MAFWVVRGGVGPLDAHEHSQHHDAYAPSLVPSSGKRRVAYYPEDGQGDVDLSKRIRLDQSDAPDPRYPSLPHHHACHDPPQHPTVSRPPDSVRVQNLAFLVIREGTRTPEHHEPHFYPPPGSRPTQPPQPSLATPMERTESGLSISSDNSSYAGDIAIDSCHDDPSQLVSDLDAAELVRAHVQHSRPDSQPARILRSLIRPRLSSSNSRAFTLDNDALRSIFRAANQLFFADRLSKRVVWDWSHPSPANDNQQPSGSRYAHHVVGTTALRRSARLGGYETLIVLSSPILRDTRYNRRLLIATFLHEMIHSFLFVMCGLKAGREGGHTEGFRQIAETIDDWVGREYLRLGDMEADLDRFRSEGDNLPSCGRGGNCGSMGIQYVDEHAPGMYHEHGEWEWYGQEGFRTIPPPSYGP